MGNSFSGIRLILSQTNSKFTFSKMVLVPELLNELQMPFEKEYELAKSIFELGN